MGAIPRPNNPTENRRLDSWKDIAAFFGRDKSTVRRWETERGLPVHRVPGMGRGSVYAFTDELQEWLRKPSQAALEDAKDAEEEPSLLEQPSPNSRPFILSPQPQRTALWMSWIALGVVVVAGVVAVYEYPNLRFWVKAESRPARARHVPSAEAQDFYLKGQFYWSKRTPESLHEAVDNFTQAVVRDPAYAQAYVGLAESYNLLREFSVMPESEAYPRALAAEKKAVELDDTSGEAHADLAFTTLYWKWDWPTAEREFKRSIALDPNNPHSHHWYATALLSLHRFPEALVQIERAQKLDPSSVAILSDKGLILYHAGQEEAGIALLRQVETAEPNFVAPHRYLASILEDKGDFAGSLAERQKTDVLLNNQVDLAITNAAERGLASGGRQGMLETTLAAEEKLYPQGGVPALALAKTLARLGKNDEALHYLREGIEQRDFNVVVAMKSDPVLDRLRNRPEFRQLEAKLNVPRPD